MNQDNIIRHLPVAVHGCERTVCHVTKPTVRVGNECHVHPVGRHTVGRRQCEPYGGAGARADGGGQGVCAHKRHAINIFVQNDLYKYMQAAVANLDELVGDASAPPITDAEILAALEEYEHENVRFVRV